MFWTLNSQKLSDYFFEWRKGFQSYARKKNCFYSDIKVLKFKLRIEIVRKVVLLYVGLSGMFEIITLTSM